MDVPLPIRCPMGGNCRLEEPVIRKRLSDKPYCFVALPYSEIYNDTEAAVRAVLEGGNVFSQRYEAKKIGDKEIKALLARNARFIGQGGCKICQLCWFSDLAIAELGSLNPNVMIEIGLLFGFGKMVIFLLNISHTSINEIPFDLGNPMLVPYASTLRLSSNLEDKINFLILTWPTNR